MLGSLILAWSRDLFLERYGDECHDWSFQDSLASEWFGVYPAAAQEWV